MAQQQKTAIAEAITSVYDPLPATGFVRLDVIIGDPDANPPKPGLFPVSAKTWWNGVKNGRYPRAYKLGPNATGWKVEDIRALLENGVEVAA